MQRADHLAVLHIHHHMQGACKQLALLREASLTNDQFYGIKQGLNLQTPAFSYYYF
jgi:hypothetical protein